MAKDVSYEERWWKTHSWFTSNESCSDVIVMDEHVVEEKVVGNEKSLSQMEQREAGLTGGVDSDKIISGRVGEKESNVRMVKKRTRKRNVIGNVGGDRKRRKDRLASVEKERRRKEMNLFEDLHALLPQLPPKTSRATIVEEATSLIKSLKQTLDSLEDEKLERLYGASTTPSQSLANETPLLINMILNNNSGQSSNTFKTWANSNITLSVCGIDAFISICSLKNPYLFTTICYILEKHNLEVVSAQISSDHAKTMYMVHVRANVPLEFAEGFPYEEMFKKAVAQIMVLVEF